MNTILAAIGFIILVGGYQLNWFFVGGVTFMLGGYLGDQYNLVNNTLDLIIFALILSGIAILLSLYFRRLMNILACSFIGGYVVYTLPQAFTWNSDWFSWQIFVIAGLFSGIAVLLWHSWGTILLTTIGGATIVIENLGFGRINDLSMFIVLVVVGLAAQFLLWQYGKPPDE